MEEIVEGIGGMVFTLSSEISFLDLAESCNQNPPTGHCALISLFWLQLGSAEEEEDGKFLPNFPLLLQHPMPWHVCLERSPSTMRGVLGLHEEGGGKNQSTTPSVKSSDPTRYFVVVVVGYV